MGGAPRSLSGRASPERRRGRSPTSATRRRPVVLVVHGPNLNLLGEREVAIYGRQRLAEIDDALARLGSRWGVVVESFQSNVEGELVNAIQAAAGRCAALVINPAGYTTTSVAIRDALLACGVPAYEVHLTNTARREGFRRESLVADVCLGRVEGFGPRGYALALRAAVERLGGPKRIAGLEGLEGLEGPARPHRSPSGSRAGLRPRPRAGRA